MRVSDPGPSVSTTGSWLMPYCCMASIAARTVSRACTPTNGGKRLSTARCPTTSPTEWLADWSRNPVEAHRSSLKILLRELPPGSRKRTATHACGAAISSATRVAAAVAEHARAPVLWAGGGLVAGWMGRVEVLVGLECARDLARQSLGDAVVALRALARRRRRADDHFGAVGAQQSDFFARHLVGHHAHQPIALERGGDGQAGAGVARGRLDDRRPWVQLASLFSRLDHRQSNAILDRSAWVETLDFGHQRRAPVRGHARQAHQRGIANSYDA